MKLIQLILEMSFIAASILIVTATSLLSNKIIESLSQKKTLKCLAESSHKWHISESVYSMTTKSLLWLINVVLVMNRSHLLCWYHLIMVVFYSLWWKGLFFLHKFIIKHSTML